jgi:hypothetical protein
MFSEHSRAFRYLLIASVFFLGYVSYARNAFMVVPDAWFQSHQIDSEQLVLDGLLNKGADGGKVVLGRYSRPAIENRAAFARELYRDRDMTGVFKRYKSQYGLQVKAFSALVSMGLGGVNILHAITALLMSAVVAGMFWILWKDFSLFAALLFAAVYVFSPWVVVFSRNLYWVSFTWYLPILLTMWLSSRSFYERRSLYLMLALLFGAYLLKCLCGYEYLTSIFVAACVPIVYHGIRLDLGLRQVFLTICLNGVALLAAFALAVTVHSQSLSEKDSSGFSRILLIAKERVLSDNPADTAKQVCDGNIDCEETISASLKSNPFSVTAKYFFVKDFLPWVSLVGHDERYKEDLQATYGNFSFEGLIGLVRALGVSGMLAVAAKALSVLSFIGLLAFIIFSFRRFSIEIRCMLITAFVAPLSWYFVAKAHSYIHYHINYVLWYLPFIPVSIIALTSMHAQKSRIKK